MEFHQLKYFVEVARQKNFTRAAEICHVAQPSLSQQLKKLEQELGQPLIRRTRQGAELTDFGESMLPQALHLLSCARNMLEEADFGKNEISGSISLGAIPTIAPYLLPTIIQATTQTYPQLQLKIVENTTDELVTALREGRLEFAILSPPFTDDTEMQLSPLFEDELLITLPSGHALAKKQRLKLRDLNDQPMVLMKDVHCLSRQSISLCKTSNITPRITLESAQLETVVSMVEAGLGFSFLPKMAQKTFQNRACSLHSIAPKTVTRSIVLAHSRFQKLSPTQNALLHLIKNNAHNT